MAGESYLTNRLLACRRPHLHRFPAKSAEVVAAIAQAPAGRGCVSLRRGPRPVGKIAILILALFGVAEEEIVADYLFLRERGTSAATEIQRLLESDLEAALAQGGLPPQDVADSLSLHRV
jgi:hypothetical protein